MTKAWPCLLAIAILLLSPLLAEANGGTIQVASHPTGPYLLTVFTSPNPIRVGTVDVSVLMQEAGGETVENALVRVTARPVDREGEETIYEATHDMATNKLYYAAHAELPEAGQWLISVHVAGDRGEGAVEFQVEATQAGRSG